MKKVAYDQNQKTTLTPEEVEAFKKEYSEVQHIEAEDKQGNSKQCWIHNPTRQILDLAEMSSKKAPSKFNETLLKNCWLAGDKEIVEDDYLFYGVSAKLDSIISFGEAAIKKL